MCAAMKVAGGEQHDNQTMTLSHLAVVRLAPVPPEIWGSWATLEETGAKGIVTPSQGAFHDAGLSACQTLDGKHQSATRAAANR